MRHILDYFFGIFIIVSCQPQPVILHETGLLVMDKARNCTSFDYFIPCSFNDTLSLGQNVRLINARKARGIYTAQFEFPLLTHSWPSSPDSFYVKTSFEERMYISPVELTLQRTDDLSVNDMRKLSYPIHIAETIIVDQFHPGNYTILHAKRIMLME